MNGFKFKFLFCLSLIGLMSSIGCKETQTNQANPAASESASTANAEPAFQSGPDAESILRDVIARYANAKTYQDEAVLSLSYELHGRSIQEPQRWSTKWAADGRLATQLFNGTVRCDNGLLSCYVYDIETANIDNQHLLIPFDRQLPINLLFRDSIAKHFLGGYSELPLDESDLLAAPKLVPPPISLLTNQARNGWLQGPTQVERLPDESLDGNACFVLRCLSEGMTSDVWIDQQTFGLVQISLPLKLLAGEVVTSPEISNVVLVANFTNAVFDEPIENSEFTLKPRADATPVLKYVSMPETIPSELIGQTAPEFQLIGQDRKPVGRLEFDGKPTALLWLAGKQSLEGFRQLDKLANSMGSDKFNFAAVYSDSELKSPGSTSVVMDDLADVIEATSIPAFYDPALTASTALKVKTIPSVIVLDGNSKVHFAKSLADKNWLKDIKAAMQRVAAGDDISAEMTREYQLFLDSYHQQLLTVSARSLIQNNPTSSLVSTPQNKTRTVANNIRIRPEKSWANGDFKQPGNLVVVSHFEKRLPLAIWYSMAGEQSLNWIHPATSSRVLN